MTVLENKGGRWSNADEDRVAIVPYHPSWPGMFEKEVAAIRQAVPGNIDFTAVHFGSTAVPGLAAKPIIDILLLVPERSQWPALVSPLESIGYAFWSANPNPDRTFFVKGMPPFGTGRTHHVHIREADDARDVVVFRDYLRAHPGEAARYEALKYELAEDYENDREAYTAAKTGYVDGVLRKARESGFEWTRPSRRNDPQNG